MLGAPTPYKEDLKKIRACWDWIVGEVGLWLAVIVMLFWIKPWKKSKGE